MILWSSPTSPPPQAYTGFAACLKNKLPLFKWQFGVLFSTLSLTDTLRARKPLAETHPAIKKWCWDWKTQNEQFHQVLASWFSSTCLMGQHMWRQRKAFPRERMKQVYQLQVSGGQRVMVPSGAMWAVHQETGMAAVPMPLLWLGQ